MLRFPLVHYWCLGSYVASVVYNVLLVSLTLAELVGTPDTTVDLYALGPLRECEHVYRY